MRKVTTSPAVKDRIDESENWPASFPVGTEVEIAVTPFTAKDRTISDDSVNTNV